MPHSLNNPSLFKTQAYINGEWRDANSNNCFAVTNPSNQQHIADVADMSEDETRSAIHAATTALVGWSALTAKARSNILRNWYQLILENQQDLALLFQSTYRPLL